MSEPLAVSLAAAVESTLETSAFLFPMLPDPTADEPLPAFATAEVTFEGACHGRLIVRCAAELLPMLAANMLGEDAAPAAAVQRDALGEIANVICGNVLPALEPGRRARLSPPVVTLEGEPHGGLPARPTATVVRDVDGLRLEAMLVLDDAVLPVAS
jgi:chemotaxis protein CheY-P-specific phosphatase CheC